MTANDSPLCTLKHTPSSNPCTEDDMHAKPRKAFSEVCSTQYGKVGAWFRGTVRHMCMAIITLCTTVFYFLVLFAVPTWIVLASVLVCTFILHQCCDCNRAGQDCSWSMSTMVDAAEERGRTRHDDNEAKRKQYRESAGLTATSDATRARSVGKTKDDGHGMSTYNKSNVLGSEQVSGTQSVNLSSVNLLDLGVVDRMPSVPTLEVCDLDSKTGVVDSARDPSSNDAHDTAGLSDEFVSAVSLIQLEKIAPNKHISHHSHANDEDISFVVMPLTKCPQHFADVPVSIGASKHPTGPVVNAPMSPPSPDLPSPEACNQRKGNKVQKVVLRMKAALKRVGSTVTTFSRQSSNNIDECQNESASFSINDAALIDMGQVLTRRQASHVRARFEHTFHSIHKPEDVSHRIDRILRSDKFGCQVSCTMKKWNKAFKMRVVSLKRKENSVLVVRILVEQNKKDAVGRRIKNTGSVVTIYPAKVGGFKGDADPGSDTLAIAHFGEFVESVEDAFRYGCERDDYFE